MGTKVLQSIVLMVAVLGLAGCGSKRGAMGGQGEEGMGVGDTVRFYGSDISPERERELLNKRTYYFGYDSNDLNDEDTLAVYAQAKRLITTPRTRVRVEGHTDMRGSREYNVALGERRANAIANLLMLKGVPQEQITVVSYGKEKPAISGHTESAWAQNRRAVIVYEVE